MAVLVRTWIRHLAVSFDKRVIANVGVGLLAGVALCANVVLWVALLRQRDPGRQIPDALGLVPFWMFCVLTFLVCVIASRSGGVSRSLRLIMGTLAVVTLVTIVCAFIVG